MDREKRKGDTPIPDNLEAVLNKAQWRALAGVELMGWELRFVRRKLFQEPVPVLRNRNDNRTGILGEDGKITIQADIKLREWEIQARTPPSSNPLVWTK